MAPSRMHNSGTGYHRHPFLLDVSHWMKNYGRFAEAAWAVHPEPTLKGAADRLLYLIRCLASYSEAQAWHEWLDLHPIKLAAAINPTLFRKIIRPYVDPRWTRERVLLALQAHFDFVAARLDAPTFLQSCTPAGFRLWEFTTDAGRHFEVRWVNDGNFSKEGELSLVLRDVQTGRILSGLTALVVREASRPGHGLLIGGVQGADPAIDKPLLKEALKGLHGLRPKALLLFVTQEIAVAWQLARIVAVDNDTHISRHHDYALNRRRRPVLAYDEFWQESGGVRRGDGYFELPLRLVRRPDVAIKAHKRSQYQQRYALLDCLAADLQARLADVSCRP